MNRKHERSSDFHIRIPIELDEKLESYSQMKNLSLSQTCRYFITLGIKSTEMLEELKNNPDKKNSVLKEWEDCLKQISTGDAVEEELTKISDDDLEIIIMMSYCEFTKRRKSKLKQKFQSEHSSISNHVESYIENSISK